MYSRPPVLFRGGIDQLRFDGDEEACTKQMVPLRGWKKTKTGAYSLPLMVSNSSARLEGSFLLLGDMEERLKMANRRLDWSCVVSHETRRGTARRVTL